MVTVSHHLQQYTKPVNMYNVYSVTPAVTHATAGGKCHVT